MHSRRGRGRTRTRERARGCARAARARRARRGRRPRPGSRTRGPAGRGWRGVRGSNGEKTGGEAARGARAGSAASARPRTSAWGSCHVANTSDGTPRSARRLAGSAMAAMARASARGVRLILGRCSFISRAKLRRSACPSHFPLAFSSRVRVLSIGGATPPRGDAAMARGRQRPRDEHVLDQVRPLVASILESPLEHRAEASAEPDEKMRPPTRPLPAPLGETSMRPPRRNRRFP